LDRLFPVKNLKGMHLLLPGDLLDGFDSLERLKGDVGFELRIVSAAFGFHGLWFLGSVLATIHSSSIG
jgi:hypothetical protein